MSEVAPWACFTGHRPKKFSFGYNERAAGCLAIKRCLAESVLQACTDYGVTHFISGMALGVDTWAAEAVLAARDKDPRLYLLAAIPCRGQESQWPLKSQRRYYGLLAHADETVLLSDEPYSPRLMHARDRWMVDRSGLLIAVFDGTPGGTAGTYAYAKKMKLDVLRIRPEPDGARLELEAESRLF